MTELIYVPKILNLHSVTKLRKDQVYSFVNRDYDTRIIECSLHALIILKYLSHNLFEAEKYVLKIILFATKFTINLQLMLSIVFLQRFTVTH